MVWTSYWRLYQPIKPNFKPRYPPLWTQGPNVNRKFYTTPARAQGRQIQTTKSRHVGFDFPDKIFSKKNREIDGEVPTSLTVAKTHISQKTVSASPFLNVIMCHRRYLRSGPCLFCIWFGYLQFKRYFSAILEIIFVVLQIQNLYLGSGSSIHIDPVLLRTL